MKTLMIVLLALLVMSCSVEGVITPDPSNAIPFMDTVTANTTYTDTFYLEGNSYFFLRVMSPVDVTVNGTDYIGFRTNDGPMGSFTYTVEFVIGDLPSGTTIDMTYGPYNNYSIKVE